MKLFSSLNADRLRMTLPLFFEGEGYYIYIPVRLTTFQYFPSKCVIKACESIQPIVTPVYFETIFSKILEMNLYKCTLSLMCILARQTILCKIWRDRNSHNKQSNLLDQKNKNNLNLKQKLKPAGLTKKLVQNNKLTAHNGGRRCETNKSPTLLRHSTQ